MPNGSYSMSAVIGDVAVSKSAIRTADHPNTYTVSLPVAHAVSSWVKTDADTAAGNLAAGHGQTSGVYDVYWTGGARYGVNVTVTVNALALDGGTGTDFPATATTTVVICKQVTINSHIDGDAAELAIVSLEYADSSSTSIGRALFEDAASDDIATLSLQGNVPLVYDIEGGATNVFAGDPIATCKVSHNNTAAAATFKIATLEDSTS